LSKRHAAKIRRVQDELVGNYTYTKEDIERNLQERKQTGLTAANLGLEQTRADLAVQSAESALAEAKSRLEDAKRTLLENPTEDLSLQRNVETAEVELKAAEEELHSRLEEQRKIQDIVERRKNKLTRRQKDVNWAKVNQRARQMNEAADYEAFKEQQARKEAESKSAGGQPKFNPYARRKVKPKILWEVGQKEEKKDDDPKEKQPDQAEKSMGDQNGHSGSAITAAQAAHEAKRAALVTEVQQINLDDDIEGLGAPGFGLSTKKKTLSRERKGISLNEYLERKAAGTL
jgi:RNA polymerase-associated protein RTF1